MKHVELVKDIAQIAFWALGSILALLTYLQAKRTILQPFRTELFKERLKAMTEIMRLFLGKGELALRKDFDFDKLFGANAFALYDAYATNVFHVTRKTQPYNSEDLPRALSMEGMPWPEHNRLYQNREFAAMVDFLQGLLENPILPRGLVDLLTKYRERAWLNQIALGETLVQAAKEMPARYPSLAMLEGASTDWLLREVHNRWNHEFKPLSPIVAEINEFIRSYFDDKNLRREYGRWAL